MNRLRLLRYQKGVDLATVAQAVGVTRQTLGRLELGNTTRPSASTALKLADYYEIPVADLLGVDDEREAA